MKILNITIIFSLSLLAVVTLGCDPMDSTSGTSENKRDDTINDIDRTSGISEKKHDDTINDLDNEPVLDPVIENPCINKGIINSIKENIISTSNNLVEDRIYTYVPNKISNIENTEIVFENISKPLKIYDGGITCTAIATIQYYGNQDTLDNIALDYKDGLNKSPEYFYSILNSKTGNLQKIGIDEHNVRDIEVFENNKFSSKGKYTISQTYSEDGSSQNSYTADFDIPVRMLASIVGYDHINQLHDKVYPLVQAQFDKEQEGIVYDGIGPMIYIAQYKQAVE